MSVDSDSDSASVVWDSGQESDREVIQQRKAVFWNIEPNGLLNVDTPGWAGVTSA